MSMGLAREIGGGFQQMENRANASRIVLTCRGSDWALAGHSNTQLAANQMARAPRVI
jgi:hypothetical protein